MITQEKLEIYDQFGGDIDHWVRSKDADPAGNMTDTDWSSIDELIQDIGLVKRKLASEQFADRLHERLLRETDGEKTIRALNNIADKYYQ